MAGDARKKGGAYSDNPKTQRTVEYIQNLPAEKREEKRKNFLEYRCLRTACIARAKKEDYQQSHSRNDRLSMLRDACNDAIAKRLKKGIEYKGTDVEAHIARFHDRAFDYGSRKNTGNSNGGGAPEADPTEEPANTHNGGQNNTAPASSPDTVDKVDSIDHHNCKASELEEDMQMLEEEHDIILEEMRFRADTQLQTARKLRLLVEASGF
ncbi:hypothetical protein LX36DRAFT_684435 [Colletotrichum falcatum]|nr:hypothetical protein LX36DRAFT_684435 [Colletotrichum falcatum]